VFRSLNLKSIQGLTIKFANSNCVLAVAAVHRNLTMVDDVHISAFHGCVVVDLWRLLLFECVLLSCIMKLSVREFIANKQITLLEHPPIHRI
jgi:hypothetical protein